MARRTDDEKIKSIYNAVKENPGKRAGFIARLLGLHRSEITRSLPALDDKRLLVYEDEEGRLYPLNEKKTQNS